MQSHSASEVAMILNRIESDVAKLRALTLPNGESTAKLKSKKVLAKPVLKDSYTAEEATKERCIIDTAYADGIITYDERRGLKRSVTIRTVGWMPDNRH